MLKLQVIMHMITSTARRPYASTRSEPVQCASACKDKELGAWVLEQQGRVIDEWGWGSASFAVAGQPTVDHPRRLCVKLFEVTNTTWENLQIAKQKSVECAEGLTLICALRFADFLSLCLSPRTTSRTIISFSISNSFLVLYIFRLICASAPMHAKSLATRSLCLCTIKKQQHWQRCFTQVSTWFLSFLFFIFLLCLFK